MRPPTLAEVEQALNEASAVIWAPTGEVLAYRDLDQRAACVNVVVFGVEGAEERLPRPT